MIGGEPEGGERAVGSRLHRVQHGYPTKVLPEIQGATAASAIWERLGGRDYGVVANRDHGVPA